MASPEDPDVAEVEETPSEPEAPEVEVIIEDPPTPVDPAEITEENVRILKDRVTELSQLEVDLNDQLLRSRAEMANQRKRGLRTQEEVRTRARSDIILRFIEVADNFSRAMNTATDGDKENPVVAGFLLVANQYNQILFDMGVEKFISKGEIYNPHRHEALSVFEQDDLKKEVVLEEIRPGYLLNGELLQAAQVVVGKPKPKPKPKAEPEAPATAMAEAEEATGSSDE